MKKIVFFMCLVIISFVSYALADNTPSWVGNKDKQAWEDNGFVYAVGNAAYSKTSMDENQTINAFGVAAKAGAGKIKTLKKWEKVQGLEIVEIWYADAEVLVLVGAPATKAIETISYPACDAETAKWETKSFDAIYNCEMAGKIYTYAIAVASYNEEKDKEKATQAAKDLAKITLADHVGKKPEEINVSCVKSVEDPTAKTIKVLCRCINPNAIPEKDDGKTKFSITAQKGGTSETKTYTSNSTDFTYTTTISNTAETANITSEAQVRLACDEMAITTFEKIPDNWWLLYAKNVKHFRVDNNLYTIGVGYKKKSDTNWTGAITGAKVDAQCHLAEITGTVITSIVCDKNDKSCGNTISTKVSGFVNGLNPRDNYQDESSKLDKKPYYILMAIPFTTIVTNF